MPTACFFARVRDASLFDLVDWYRNDIQILRDLGFEVVVARRWREIPWACDLYFTWWWGSGVLPLVKSRLTGRPNIVTGTLQLTPEIHWWRQLGPVKRAVVKWCLFLSSTNLAISDAELEHLQALGAPRCRKVSLGIDTDYYQPRLGARSGKTIITISHLTEENVFRKCVEQFIRAAPRVLQAHPDARFLVIGGWGDGYPRMAQLVQSLGVGHAVTFPGRISTEEKLRQYRGAAVLAQATLYEGFGSSIAEAMSCAVPVVTSTRGSVPELAGDCALFVEPHDAEGMADRIVSLLDDSARAEALGQRARARIVERFSLSARRQKMAQVVSSVLPGWTSPVVDAEATS